MGKMQRQLVLDITEKAKTQLYEDTVIAKRLLSTLGQYLFVDTQAYSCVAMEHACIDCQMLSVGFHW